MKTPPSQKRGHGRMSPFHSSLLASTSSPSYIANTNQSNDHSYDQYPKLLTLLLELFDRMAKRAPTTATRQ
jgi:hypothetical protein